jgi:hypothetical protein
MRQTDLARLQLKRRHTSPSEAQTMIGKSSLYRGVVRGTTIELDEETGLPEGQQVAVTVQPVEAMRKRLPPGEGLRRSFGAWADDAKELDRFLEWNRQQRKIDRPEVE